MRSSSYFISFLGSILFFSCANEQMITGGEKDMTPPNLVNTFPTQNQRTNFKGNKLIFEFDEAIKVQNFTNEVRITPFVKGVENEIQKNKLIIQLNEPLEENTTYTINFGNAVRDVTENNVAKNIIFAFSTGPKMDSLTLKGSVKNFFTNLPENEVLIALYPAKDTLAIEHGNPKYYVFSNAQGIFEFNYLKADAYKAYAIKDKNKNTKYELGESIDFFPQNIDLKGVNQEISFMLFQESHQKNKVISVKQVENYVEIKCSKGIKKVLSSKENWIINADGKILKSFPIASEEGKSYNYHLQLQDSLNKTIDTTFQITYKNLPIPTTTFSPKVNPENKEYVGNDFQTTLSFTEPIEINSTGKIELSTSKKSYTVEKEDYLLKNGNSELFIHKKNINSDSILLIIHSNSILSTINRKNTVGNDSILYIKKKIEALSSVRGKINTNYQHFTIQLIDKNGKIVAESSNKGSFEFTHVKPDTYTLRVLIDENGDGLFEKGSYLEKIRPEKIFFHPSPILLKANWEITDLILTF